MEQQTTLREPGKPFKVEAIEWEKTCTVRDLRESRGYSTYELSFLLAARRLRAWARHVGLLAGNCGRGQRRSIVFCGCCSPN
ncbi:hypothetical protein SAMN05216436_10171 [bacterium A37T11]|nr:hypothetical protein SAMN05216436_10171 [bacterium A37T11]